MKEGFQLAYESSIPTPFIVVIIIMIGTFIFIIISNSAKYAKNKSSPILTTRAKVVTKRTNLSHYDSMNDDISSSHAYTTYFVTFETDAGQRIELTLSDKDYGMLADGDIGELIYQGEWFKGFKRNIM